MLPVKMPAEARILHGAGGAAQMFLHQETHQKR